MENNELVEKICALRTQFENLAAKHSDDEGFADSVNAALDENEFLPQEKIREDYKKNAEKDRLLRIGIVGAVKAGKSSLLNSLFFDGQDILPKAATPMTAALTELSYGEQCEVTVDFFTENDIQSLREKSENYKRELSRLTEENLNIKRKAWLKNKQKLEPLFEGKPSSENEKQFKEESAKMAKSKVDSNVALSGAYQQYEMIENASAERKTGTETFSVGSVSEIAGKLEDYVGSSGKYMPFTSKVSITLPIEDLKGICVIDTPGFNDPVPSRDDRARKSLRECDVVFILSPARQFISANDKEVMSKITSKNGIRELYLISSQVDGQLFNQEFIDEANGDLNFTLNQIKQTLAEVTKKNLRDINGDGIFNELLEETENRLYPTSAICDSMQKTLDNKDSWDSGRKNTWKNLTKNYPDYFSDSDLQTSKSSLEMLGNIEPIYSCVTNVKSKKEDIFKQKLLAFESKYQNAAKDTKKEILEYIEKRESDLKNKDLGKLEREIAELQKAYNLIGPELKDSFVECVMEWYNDVKTDFENTLKSAKGEAKSGVSAAEGSYEHEWKTGILFWKKWHSKTITTANLSEIKNSIDDYIEEYNDNLPHFLNTEIYRLTKKVLQTVQKTWSEYSTSGSDELIELRNKVRSTLAAMNFEYDLEYKGSSFQYNSYFHSSQLSGSDAEECISRAKEFVNQLDREFKSILHGAIEDIFNKCKKCDFAKNVLDGYLKKLEKSKADIEQPKLALENFKRMKNELEKIGC